MDTNENTDNSMSPQDALYEQFLEEERAREKARIEERNKVLKKVESLVSTQLYIDITEVMDTCDNIFNLRIANSPIGSIQTEEYEELKSIHISQDGGGMTGDDFWGTISIEISKDTYFIFEYNC